ncbi:MAG: radical SAM family heme chaperone HemW [Candidatus Baltobacteraceae bacterium]
MLGIYVHLPFCPYVCPYCDFAKWRYDGAAARRYLRALAAQLDAGPSRPAATLFLGGGTPNTYATADLAELVARIRERFSLSMDAEATIEVNPDLALCGAFGALRRAGLSRLSIGVQSFVPRELQVLGRRHAPEDVAEAVRRARAAGFTNVSLDLMFGVPGQTVASWATSLEAAIALEVDHVSTYGLTVEAGTPYARWQAREPGAFADPDFEAELYALAIERLRSAGYEQYEVSNFAQPGRRCAHNANYWANGEYLGLGVGAASYADGTRSATTRDLDVFCEAATAGRPIPAERETLAGPARVGEATMLALRTNAGVDVRLFAERYGIDFLEMYATVLDELRAAEAIVATPDTVKLTDRGRFLANDVCGAFLEPAP